MRRNRKRIYIISILFLISILLSGCASHKGNSKAQEAPQEIIIWAWDETFNIKAAKMAAEEYEHLHTDVRIIIETKEREEIMADVKNILSAKVYQNLPDIIMMEDYDVQAVLASYDDEFVDLTDRIDYERFVDYKKQLCSRDGRMYGIPFDSGTAVLFYRLDILERAGYTEEDMQNLTWDRYIEIGKDVYSKTGIPMLTLDSTDLPLIRLIMQSNGKWYVKQDGSTPDIVDNIALHQALEVYLQLLQNDIGKSVNGWNEFISSFQKGEVATILSGGWIISSIKENEEQTGLWRVAPIPIVAQNPDAVAASNVGGSAWYVLKNSANSQAATDFVVTMFGENDAFLDKLIEEIGIIPSVKDPTVFYNYEAEEPFFGGQQVTKILTQLANRIPAVNYGSKTYEIENILEAEFQNSLRDGDINQCLERVQMKAEAVARE